ncbi:MAG: hypothetical protein KDD58_12160 [Bdellovibrionales bacterium]|nr:hypothetical protein [Bdellovibrionales bacterium]
MKAVITLIILFISSIHVFAMVPIEDSLNACIESLDPGATPSAVFHPDAEFVKPEQHANIKNHVRQISRAKMRALQLKQESVYKYTNDSAPRQTQWTQQGIEELNQLTGWTVPFGVSYNPTTHTTKFVAIGDPSLVSKINLRFFNDGENLFPARKLELIHLPLVNDGLAWAVEIEGNFEGTWYDFEYQSIPGAISFANEPIPETYSVVDPMALWVTSTRARIYFPPDKTNRPLGPFSKLDYRPPTITLEMGLKDIVPADVADSQKGWALTLLESSFAQEMIAPYSMLEFLPVRRHAKTEVFSFDQKKGDDLVRKKAQYFHYWGYMPDLFGIDLSVGGPDALISLIDKLHGQCQAVMKDEVVQHTANKPSGSHPPLNVFHFALKNVYRPWNDDLTGCGNVTNLDWGNTYTKLIVQLIINDILHFGWDGYRFDLMGAIPRDTTQHFADLIHRLRALVTGEPYAANYVMSLWHTERDVLRGASLWDKKKKKAVPLAIKNQAPLSELLKWMGGGSYFTWVDSSRDRTAVLETHDGQTQTHFFNGDLRKVMYGIALQLFSMGDVTLTLSQVLAINHGYLDNTPIDMESLSDNQISHMKTVNHYVRLRRQLNPFFAWPHLDEESNENYVEISNQSQNYGYLWLKKPAYKSIEVDQNQQVVILINNSQYDHNLQLPPGDWVLQAPSPTLIAEKATHVTKAFNVPPFTVTVLTKMELKN